MKYPGDIIPQHFRPIGRGIARVVGIALFSVLFSACGSSGGGSSSSRTPDPDPEPAVASNALPDRNTNAVGRALTPTVTIGNLNEEMQMTVGLARTKEAADDEPNDGSVTQSSMGTDETEVTVERDSDEITYTLEGTVAGISVDVAVTVATPSRNYVELSGAIGEGDTRGSLYVDIVTDIDAPAMVTTTTGAMTVEVDNDWLAIGLWLYHPVSVSVVGDIHVGAFANGGQPYNTNVDDLTGFAEYFGGAYGISWDASTTVGGHFNADVHLIADFGADNENGEISGRVYNFDGIAGTYDGELLLGTASIGTNGFFQSTTSAEVGWSGQWGGQFYGTEHSNADDHPGSVAGTFGASQTVGGDLQQSILGVFTAYYGDDYDGPINRFGAGRFEEIYDPLIESDGSSGLQIGQSTVENGNTGDTGEVPTVTPDFHDGELHLALEHTGSEVPFSVDSNTDDDEISRLSSDDSTYININVEGRGDADEGRVVTYMLTSLKDADAPTGGTGAVPTDTDWLAGGVWYYIPDDGYADHGAEFGAFGRGTDPFTQSNVAGLTGRADYVGEAIGLIGNSRGFSYYEADVELTAEFGTNSLLGTISGTVSNFDEESGLTGQLTLGEAGIGDSTGGRFSGALSGNIDGIDYTGTWGGAFFGNGAQATDHPEDVVGTFGGDDGAGSSIVGAFAAELQ